MIEIRVLRRGSMHIKTACERFDDDGVDTLALASGPVPHGPVDRLGDGTDRLLNAHDASGVVRRSLLRKADECFDSHLARLAEKGGSGSHSMSRT